MNESLKSTFTALQFCRRQYGSTFIRLTVVATEICEITCGTYCSSRSPKIIDFDANRKRARNFLLVIDSNFGLILYRFRSRY